MIAFFLTAKRFLYFLPLGLILIWGIFQSIQAPLGDFANYYFGSVLFLKGRIGPQIFDPVWFNQTIENLGISGVFGSFSPFPPAIALIFTPLAWLKPEAAKLVFLILSSGLFLVFLIRWFRVFEIPNSVAILIPIVFFKPIQSNLFQGQVYVVLFILMVEGFIAFQKNRIWLCSLLWGTTVLLKIFPAILILLLLGKRPIRSLSIFFGVFVLMLAICVSVQGWEIWSYFFSEILPKAAAGKVIDRFAISFQSWISFLSFLFIYEPIANPFPMLDSPILFDISLLFVKSLILACCIGVTVIPINNLVRFSILVLSGILLTPTGTVYALFPCMVLIFLLFSSAGESQFSAISRFAILFLLFLICNFSFHLHDNWPLVFRYSRLFLVLLLWFSIIPQTVFNWKVSGLIFLIFIPSAWAFTQKEPVSDPSVPFPVAIQSGLLVSYSVEIGNVALLFRDQKGLQVQNHQFDIHSIDHQSILIENGQIFFQGIPILKSPDLKKSPVLVNGNTVLFLSDKNRGQGFYSLRLLTLHHD